MPAKHDYAMSPKFPDYASILGTGKMAFPVGKVDKVTLINIRQQGSGAGRDLRAEFRFFVSDMTEMGRVLLDSDDYKQWAYFKYSRDGVRLNCLWPIYESE